MASIASINLKKSNPFQMFHNSTVRPGYAIGGELYCNLKGYEAKKLKEKIIREAIESYNRTKKPKAPSFKATSYEWSAVCNIKENTTMADLERLAQHFQDKYGFQCYQIAIHRDEGHINDNGEKVINHHAHLEFITLDKETGKQCFKLRDFPPNKMREIQTEVAEILQMERGIDKRISGAKRIEPRTYARMKELERQTLRELKAEAKELIENEIQKANTLELEKHDIIREANKIIDEANDIIDKKEQRIQELTQDNAQKDYIIQEATLTQKQIKEKFEKERQELIRTGIATQKQYRILSEEKKKALDIAKNNGLTGNELDSIIQEALKIIKFLHQENQSLTTTNTELEKQNGILRQNQNLLARENQRIMELEQTIENLTQSNAEQEQEIWELTQEKRILESKIRDLEQKLENVDSQNTQNSTRDDYLAELQAKISKAAQEQQERIKNDNNTLMQDSNETEADNKIYKPTRRRF